MWNLHRKCLLVKGKNLKRSTQVIDTSENRIKLKTGFKNTGMEYPKCPKHRFITEMFHDYISAWAVKNTFLQINSVIVITSETLTPSLFS